MSWSKTAVISKHAFKRGNVDDLNVVMIMSRKAQQ
jgi:hypothetical protein